MRQTVLTVSRQPIWHHIGLNAKRHPGVPPLHRKGLLLCRYYWFGGTDRGEDLLIFASDYPHHEGTDNPIGRFEKTMKTTPKALKQKFYTENFKVLLDKN